MADQCLRLAAGSPSGPKPTRVYLVRHGETAVLGRILAGRMPGIHLTAHGRGQAAALAECFRPGDLDRILSSPLERALESGEFLARRLGLAIEVEEGFNEVDFGEWTGMAFSELCRRPEWQAFNRSRSGFRIPGGESMGEVQARFCRRLETLHSQAPGGRILVLSHADPIRAAIVRYRGLPLDAMLEHTVEPAETYQVLLQGGSARVFKRGKTRTKSPAAWAAQKAG